MTQHDANNAVKRIRRKLQSANGKPVNEWPDIVRDATLDLLELETLLTAGKKPAPNCRPATQAELEALCQGGNVVMFPAVA